VPVGYTIVADNEKEYEPVRELTTAQAGCLLIADKDYWGRAYAETLALQGVTIETPDRVRNPNNLARERHLASLRLVIESTISNLKGQMRLEQHLAKTPRGLVQRIAQDCSHSQSASSSTPSPDAHHAPSSPMTAAEPTSGL
jgi:hypothetical protein